MNNAQLQDAIDRARIWLAPQIDYKTTPSNDLKTSTVEYIKKLQEIQVIRAGLMSQARITKKIKP